MSWTTAIDDVRRLLSDGPKDKLRHRKRVLGKIDGTNVTFKTLEFRRLTDFTTASAPEGVYVDGVTAPVTLDDPSNTGEFNVTTAPVDGSVVEATYFIQWFTDSEITGFLTSASNWILQSDVYDNISPGLRPAAIHYAAQEAYQKLAVRWAEELSETYRLQDAPSEGAFEVVDKYRTIAMDMHKKSMALRDDFYKRSGKTLQPLFGNIAGNVRDPVPKA
jgi:hypothetical protein